VDAEAVEALLQIVRGEGQRILLLESRVVGADELICRPGDDGLAFVQPHLPEALRKYQAVRGGQQDVEHAGSSFRRIGREAEQGGQVGPAGVVHLDHPVTAYDGAVGADGHRQPPAGQGNLLAPPGQDQTMRLRNFGERRPTFRPQAEQTQAVGSPKVGAHRADDMFQGVKVGLVNRLWRARRGPLGTTR